MSIFVLTKNNTAFLFIPTEDNKVTIKHKEAINGFWELQATITVSIEVARNRYRQLRNQDYIEDSNQ